MTPHNDVFSLDSSLTVAEALPKVADNRFSRIPLHEGDSDSFNKLLYMRDLLTAVASGNENARLADISHEPIFVSQYQAIDEFFNTLLRKKRHFAIVVDEHGVIRGVVTLEDLIEELVGEIYDESDDPTDDIKVISDDEIEINGAAELRIIEEFFHIEMPSKSTDTIRLWILKNNENIPMENEVLIIDSFEITILKATPRQIDKVKIKHIVRAETESK